MRHPQSWQHCLGQTPLSVSGICSGQGQVPDHSLHSVVWKLFSLLQRASSSPLKISASKSSGNQPVVIPFFQNMAAPLAGSSWCVKEEVGLHCPISWHRECLLLLVGWDNEMVRGRLQALPVLLCRSWCTVDWASGLTAPQKDHADTLMKPLAMWKLKQITNVSASWNM